MSQQSFDLTPGENLVNYNLHFTPLSAVIDNMTPYWVRLPDAGRYIAPYSTGGSVPLINAMGGTVLWEAPAIAGIATIPFITNSGVLHITFVDEVLSYTPPSAIPDIAFNNSDSFTWAVGTTLTQSIPFLAIGTRIDNPSGTAYTIAGTGLVIPPWTIGYTIDILPPYNTITIQPVANPSGVPNVSIGGPLTLVAYSGKIGISPGIVSGSTNGIWTGTNIIPVALVGTQLFSLEPTAGSLTLSKIIFRNPTIAQTYSIYREAALSSNGLTVTVPPVNPAYGNLPATVRYQESGWRVFGTPNCVSGGTSIGAVVPASATIGDTLCFAVASSVGQTWPAVTGWTLRSAGTTRLGIYTRVCIAGDPGTTVTTTSLALATLQAVVVSVHGAFDALSAVSAFSSSTTVTFAGVTAVANNGIVLAFAMTTASATVTFTPGTADNNFIERADVATTTGGVTLCTELISQNFATSGLKSFLNSTASVAATGVTISVSFSMTPMSTTLGTKLATTASIPTGATTTVDVTALVGSILQASDGATGGLMIVGDTGAVGVVCDIVVTT